MKKAVNRFIPKTRKLGSTVVKKLDVNSIQDFYILLSDPHKPYLPGDQIKGEIYLSLKRNLVNVSIDLSLIGSIKAKNSISATSFRSKKKTLFNHVIRIYPGPEFNENEDFDYPDLQNGLTKGQHIFPFIAQLPRENIFTSISFEKGSIGYKLKASIGEITSEDESLLFTCEKLLQVLKPINVAALPQPKVKTLVVKYPTKKLKKTISHSSTINSSAVSVGSQENLPSSGNTPNVITSAYNSVSPQADNHTNNNSNASMITKSVIDHSKIKLSVEIPSLGYLRGELVPVKVSLQHIKRVQNINGLIITLIRICKVDFGPDGPVQSFRKDLSQTIAPLYVDPQTFQAEINSSVRVPADVFPTITGNELISFQYSIEVILNLSNSKGVKNHRENVQDDDEDLNRVMTSNNASATQMQRSINAGDSPGDNFNSSQQVSNSIFNVDKLKRLKNVLTLNTEIIIGTKRSEARRGSHRRHRGSLNVDLTPTPESSTSHSTPITSDSYVRPPPIDNFGNASGSSPIELASPSDSPSNSQNIGLSTPSPTSRGSGQMRHEIPEIPQFTNLTEKQLLQLRETSLYPSEPVYTTSDNLRESMITIPEHVSSHHQIDPHSSNEMIDYVPMYEEYDKNSENRADNEAEDDDLYERSKLATQIEGINVDVSESTLSNHL